MPISIACHTGRPQEPGVRCPPVPERNQLYGQELVAVPDACEQAADLSIT